MKSHILSVLGRYAAQADECRVVADQGGAGHRRGFSTAATKLDSQLTGLRSDLFKRVDKIEGDANIQLSTLGADAVDQIAATRTELMGELSEVVPAARQTLMNASAPTKDLQDSIDDSYGKIAIREKAAFSLAR